MRKRADFDRAVDQYIAQLDALAEREGLDAAREKAVVQFTAITIWLKEAYGVRNTYGVVQAAADQLAAFECR
jgi:hypothetical protein